MYTQGPYTGVDVDTPGAYTRVSASQSSVAAAGGNVVGVPTPVITVLSPDDRRVTILRSMGDVTRFARAHLPLDCARWMEICRSVLANGAAVAVLPLDISEGGKLISAPILPYAGCKYYRAKVVALGDGNDAAHIIRVYNGAEVQITARSGGDWKVYIAAGVNYTTYIQPTEAGEDIEIPNFGTVNIRKYADIPDNVTVSAVFGGGIDASMADTDTPYYYYDADANGCIVGQGVASETTWYVLQITAVANAMRVTAWMQDLSTPGAPKIGIAEKQTDYVPDALTWGAVAAIVPDLIATSQDEVARGGTYVFCAASTRGSYDNYAHDVAALMASAEIHVPVLLDAVWKYWTSDLAAAQRIMVDALAAVDARAVTVYDEDLLRVNIYQNKISINDPAVIAAKSGVSDQSETITAAIAGVLAAAGGNTATARALQLPETYPYPYDDAQIAAYNQAGCLMLHRVPSSAAPRIYIDRTSYVGGRDLPAAYTRGYAVRTINALCRAITQMYVSVYLGRLRASQLHILRQDIVSIVSDYQSAGYIAPVDPAEIIVAAEGEESVRVTMPVRINQYIDILYLDITI